MNIPYMDPMGIVVSWIPTLRQTNIAVAGTWSRIESMYFRH